jgi:general L-amino acid transport system permease protein
MAVQGNTSAAPARSSFLNDPVIRGIIYQVVVAGLVVAFFYWIVLNTAQNLAAQNMSTGFDFLWRTGGFDISFTLIPWDRTSTYFMAFLAGLLNTLLVAAVGIVLATILGFALGIARLSSNWLVARFATVYIETIRNIPLLLQLFFWYFAVLAAMPNVRNSLQLPLNSFINQRGLIVPMPMPDSEFNIVLVVIALAVVAAIAFGRWVTARRTATGYYPAWVNMAGRIANAFVTLALAALAMTLLPSVAPGLDAFQPVLLIIAVALAAASFTPFAPIARAVVTGLFALVIVNALLAAMFPALPQVVVVLASLVAGIGVGVVNFTGAISRPRDQEGFPWALIILAVVGIPTLVYWVSGATLAFEMPVLERFNFRGGLHLPPELVALVFGLTVYTAAFIAENVRGGIRAVSHGQTEAAQSLGLKEGDRLRLVIIPQAMRVIVPPLTSQYLNLTKNSSLGAAIGYPELVNVFTGTTLNQTGRAIEVIALTMAVYLTFSLLTSAFMNWYNGRVAMVER